MILNFPNGPGPTPGAYAASGRQRPSRQRVRSHVPTRRRAPASGSRFLSETWPGRPVSCREHAMVSVGADALHNASSPNPRPWWTWLSRGIVRVALMGVPGGIVQVRRELDRGPREDNPECLQFVDETEIRCAPGSGRRGDGSPARARGRGDVDAVPEPTAPGTPGIRADALTLHFLDLDSGRPDQLAFPEMNRIGLEPVFLGEGSVCP
jgi:hypothetical protein